MSKNVLTTTLAAIACAAVVSAQEPQTPQAPAPTSQPPAPAQRAPAPTLAPADNLTVTGCLERQPDAAGARPGAVGTAGRVETPGFILTKVMKPAGTAGSTAAPAPTSYRLDADDSKLSGHVGQKVEITGMLADRPADNDSAKGSISAPRLKVDNVKMIASTCTE